MLESLRDDINARRDKNFFWASGTQVYCGRQGSGKTVSAVKHVHQMKDRYPLLIIVSNVSLKYFKPITFSSKAELLYKMQTFDPQKQYVLFKDIEQLSIALVEINNGFHGVVYLVDEIHTYFNSLESKNVPMFVFTEISQQRKQRKLIIGTSQLFTRLSKPFREQCDNLIICRTIMGIFTIQQAYDGMTLEVDYDGNLKGNRKRTGWFFHNRRLRNSFDTYQKVVSASEQYEQIQRPLEIASQKRKLFGLK